MAEFKTPLRQSKRLQDKFEIPASPLMKKIGFGTGVAVYELQRSPVYSKARSPWAIKKLIQRDKKHPELEVRIQEEAEVLRKLNHTNIIGFRAFLKDSKGRNMLAMEECTSCLGDMIETRFDENLGPFPAKIIMKVVQDVSDALDYLHNKALLMHCDIKSYNVLVKNDFEICKLCDFGVCLPVTKDGIIDRDKAGEEHEYVGTNAWYAPEIIKYPQEISTKADIYAFGLVIWETIALSPPMNEELAESLTDSFTESDIVFENSFCRKRPPLPDVSLGKEYNFILELYYCCTCEKAQDRPSANNLVFILKDMVKLNC